MDTLSQCQHFVDKLIVILTLEIRIIYLKGRFMVQIKKNPDNLEISNLAKDRGSWNLCIETYYLELLVTYRSIEVGIRIQVNAYRHVLSRKRYTLSHVIKYYDDLINTYHFSSFFFKVLLKIQNCLILQKWNDVKKNPHTPLKKTQKQNIQNSV